MIDFHVSWLPLVTVAVVNFIVSWFYYSPAAPWFKAWQRGVGMDPNKKEMTEADRKAMPGLMLGAVVATFLFPYGLQVLVHSVHAVSFGAGAVLGLLVWVTFVVSVGLNTMFEGRKAFVIVLNNILYAITYAVFGGLFAVWS